MTNKHKKGYNTLDMKFSQESEQPKKSHKALRIAGAALAATSVFGGLSQEIAHAQPNATSTAEYLSDNDKKIMSAANILDGIIADGDAAVSVEKIGRNSVISATIVRDGQKITVHKVDGKYVDTYTAEKELSNNRTSFVNIFRDNDTFVVVAGEVKDNAITRAATYNKGIEKADADFAVSVLNQFN